MENSLLWIRNDFSTLNNHALFRSQITSRSLIALYIISPTEYSNHQLAPVKVDFILRNLHYLKNSLLKLGIPLIITTQDIPQDIPSVVAKICSEFSINRAFWNIEYEVDELKRDAATLALLSKNNIKVTQLHDQCIIEPGKVKTKEGKVYNVFTPFKKSWIQMVKFNSSILKPYDPPKVQEKSLISSKHWDLINSEYSTIPSSADIGFPLPKLSIDISKEWPAGEEEALSRLDSFISEKVKAYDQKRDFPSVTGTSKLSAYLACGVISARTCLLKAREANSGNLDSGNNGLVIWISEIIWREFYRNILFAYPRVCKNKAFKPETDSIPWNHNAVDFQKWCDGKTGFPIVDAGMRQLNTTGWMHNRLRMVTAMFLTKHLLIDWRLGEKYFMNNLIDGDFASNNGGWQWASSTGTDSQPYFRVFNPQLQAERFDKDASFIKEFVPELQTLKGKAALNPYQELSPVEFGKLGYPKPMVDHKKAREKCLETFKTALAKFKK